jgi:very-short-patch-repair endonuclease
MRKKSYGRAAKPAGKFVSWNNMEGRSPIEHVLAQILKGMGIRYKQNQYIGGMEVDFLLEDEKLVIEANGKWYHTQEKDSRKANKLYELGYRVIQVWGTDIMNRPEKVRRRIKNKARMRGINIMA